MLRVRTPHLAVAEVGQRLGEFLARHELAKSGISPQSGSPASVEDEVALPPASRPEVNGSVLAHATLAIHLRMLVSMDCMKGIVSSIESGTSFYSVFPLARTSLEGFSYASWILEPEIGAARRALRGALDHKKSTQEVLSNERTYKNHALISDDHARELDARIGGLAETVKQIKTDLAAARQLVPQSQRDGYPSATKAVADAIDKATDAPGAGASSYGYLCVVVHPGAGGVLRQRPFEEDRDALNINVERYLAPIAIASHSMGLSLARLSQHWGLGFQASDSRELLDAMREHMYRFGSDLAFS